MIIEFTGLTIFLISRRSWIDITMELPFEGAVVVPAMWQYFLEFVLQKAVYTVDMVPYKVLFSQTHESYR